MEWLDGFDKVPIAEQAQGSFTGTSAWKIILHTMEGRIGPSEDLFHRNGYAPHCSVSLDKGIYHQHNSLAKASSALRNARGGVETNRANCIQVEIEGFASDTASWSEDKYRLLVDRVLVPIIRAQPLIEPRVPFDFAVDYGDAKERTRLTNAQWRAAGGILGHCHVPENTHWDPGALDIDLVESMLGTALASGDGYVDLRRGSTGWQVRDLQNALNWVQHSGLVVDGKYGKNTEKAVRRYQKTLKVPVTGVWGSAGRHAHTALIAYLKGLAEPKPLPPPPAPPVAVPVVASKGSIRPLEGFTLEERVITIEHQLKGLQARIGALE